MVDRMTLNVGESLHFIDLWHASVKLGKYKMRDKIEYVKKLF